MCLGFADQISTILAENFIQTSDIRSDHIKKKYEVGRFLNPELCEISERLVFDEPVFNLSGANCVEPENEALVRAEIYENEALRMEAGKPEVQIYDLCPIVSTRGLAHGFHLYERAGHQGI